MQIFAKGIPEEYLTYMQAVLRLIGNKGLNAQCKKLMKERNEQMTVLEALKHMSIGPQDLSSKEDPDKVKAKIKETKELALETQKQYNEEVASTYELRCNLPAGEPQSQWDRIVQEMHERDSWADVDGKRHNEKRPRTWTSFQELPFRNVSSCISSRSSPRQKCNIQMTVRKPQRATVCEFLLKIPHHAPGRLFEGVACPSALGRDPTRAKNQNLQLRNRVVC